MTFEEWAEENAFGDSCPSLMQAFNAGAQAEREKPCPGCAEKDSDLADYESELALAHTKLDKLKEQLARWRTIHA